MHDAVSPELCDLGGMENIQCGGLQNHIRVEGGLGGSVVW